MPLRSQAMASLYSTLQRRYGIARSTLVYRGNPWKRRRARAFYRQFIRRGDLCFDVGAHVGDRIGHFLSLGAHVVAVEPQPRLMAGLKRRFGDNPRVQLIATAVGATRGTARLAIDPVHPTVATLSRDYIAQAGGSRGFRHVNWREEIEVEVTTLDALIAAHGVPAFCKIDVEGFEHAVLEGLSRPLPGLSLEYLPAALEPALLAIARLDHLGRYRFNRSAGESMALALPRWLGAAEISAELKRISHDEKAGDVYAFLDDGETSR